MKNNENSNGRRPNEKKLIFHLMEIDEKKVILHFGMK